MKEIQIWFERSTSVVIEIVMFTIIQNTQSKKRVIEQSTVYAMESYA